MWHSKQTVEIFSFFLFISKVIPVLAYKNAVYFASPHISGREFYPQNLSDVDLTHVFYAFSDVQDDGTVFLADNEAAVTQHHEGDSPTDWRNELFGCFKQLYKLKKKQRHLKVLLSIGGSNSTSFAQAAGTAENRMRFALTAVKLLRDLGLDGLEIDWEYPVNITEATNLVSLLAILRATLNDYASKHANAYHFLLSVASPAATGNYGVLDLTSMDNYVDIWNLKAYDYAGSWSSVTAHTANLRTSKSKPNENSTVSAIDHYKTAGIPLEKILLGVSLMGRAFEKTEGLGHPFEGVREWYYQVLPKADAVVGFDKDMAASYSYDKTIKEFVSYDNVDAVKAKADYVMERGLGGVTFWDSSADREGKESLVSITKNRLNDLERTQNWLTYPVSQYVNMVAGMPDEEGSHV